MRSPAADFLTPSSSRSPLRSCAALLRCYRPKPPPPPPPPSRQPLPLALTCPPLPAMGAPLAAPVTQVKDKATAYVSVKASIKDFITMYADQHPELTQRYQALIKRLLDP